MIRQHLRAVHAPELKPEMRTPLIPANFLGFWPFSQDFFDFLTPYGSYLRVWGKGRVEQGCTSSLSVFQAKYENLARDHSPPAVPKINPSTVSVRSGRNFNVQCILSGSWKIFYFQVSTVLHYIRPHGDRSTSFFMLNTKKISRVDELIFRVIVTKTPPEQHEIVSGLRIR